MKKYFLYSLKKSLPAFALMFVFMALVYAVPAAVRDYSFWNGRVLAGERSGYVELYLADILTVFAVLSAAAPFYFLFYKTNKRSADMYYSLPITRTKLLFVQYAAGFLCVVAAYTAAYILGFIIVASRVKGLCLIYYLWVYSASLIPAYILYSIVSFALTRANTLWDALIIAAAFYFAPAAVVCFFEAFIPEIGSAALRFQLGEPMISAGRLISGVYGEVDRWDGFGEPSVLNVQRICELTGIITAALLSAAATAVMFLTERNMKAENCGQISDTVFGYKTLIPIYLIGVSGAISDIWVIPIIAFAAFAVTVVWKRTVKIGRIQALLFAVYVLAAVAVSAIASAAGAL